MRSFAEYDTDLETFMREIVLPDCPPPLFALGHSTGATVLIRAAYRGHRWFDRMVLIAPLIATRRRRRDADRKYDRARAAAGRLRLHVCPRRRRRPPWRRVPSPTNILTSDPVRYARNAAVLEAEPMLAIGRPTVAWVDAAFRAMRTMRERSYPARIRQPILIVSAGLDVVVSNAAIEEFATYLRTGSHLVVVGSKHELLMEQDRYRSQFWAAFDAFVPGGGSY